MNDEEFQALAARNKIRTTLLMTERHLSTIKYSTIKQEGERKLLLKRVREALPLMDKIFMGEL